MSQRIILAFIAFFMTAAAASVSADPYGPWYAGPRAGYGYGGYGGYGVGYGLGLGYGLGYGLGGFQASDPISSYATGMGNLIRSEGDYNEKTARGMVQAEEARNRYIQNQQQAFTVRQSIKRAAQSETNKTIEANQAAHARAEQFLASHRPLPLTDSQLDPSNGKIEWPVALKLKDFDELRSALESASETRFRSGASPELVSQMRRTVGELKDALRAHIQTMPLNDYSEGRRFLDSLVVSIE